MLSTSWQPFTKMIVRLVEQGLEVLRTTTNPKRPPPRQQRGNAQHQWPWPRTEPCQSASHAGE